MFSLQNKIALVTGAGSGIGAAIAETFARAGAFVFVTDCDEKSGRETTDRLKAQKGQAEFLALDVTNEENCRRVAKTVFDSQGRMDVLVNNAGIGHVGTMMQTSGADLDRLYAVNVRGVFNVTKAFLPDMLKRKSGNIINLASIGGVVGVRDRVAYCTTKFAVAGLTKSMALDHAQDGIRVNCICPGITDTPMLREHIESAGDPAAVIRERTARVPVGRFLTPEDIARGALYLVSDDSEGVTGIAHVVDGGYLSAAEYSSSWLPRRPE